MKVYKSYDEINMDLKILKLRQEIDIEEAKLNFKLTKKHGSPRALLKTATEVAKMKVKEITYVSKRVAEHIIDVFSNKSDSSNLEIKVEKITPPDSDFASTETIISSSNTGVKR